MRIRLAAAYGAKDKDGVILVPRKTSRSITDQEKSSSPMVFVDQQEMPRGFDIRLIDANRIETVDVFKEKSAIQQYGKKGENGVVSIRIMKEDQQ